ALICLIMVACATDPASLVGRLLNARLMVTLGTLSYSLYLWQQPFLRPASPLWMCHWPMNLILTLACATASYGLIERPFLLMKERFFASRLRKTVGCIPSDAAGTHVISPTPLSRAEPTEASDSGRQAGPAGGWGRSGDDGRRR